MLPRPPAECSHQLLHNKNGDVLLGNWVEERQVRPYDPEGLHYPETNVAKMLKAGNPGILTTKQDQKMKKTTTSVAAYGKPRYPPNRVKGCRKNLIEQTLAQEFRKELIKKLEVKEQAKEPTDYSTNYDKFFNDPDFVPTFPEPTRPHDVNTEMSISFWSEHADQVHGVSDIGRKTESFKKDTTFSKPIYEKYDDPLHMDHNTTLRNINAYGIDPHPNL